MSNQPVVVEFDAGHGGTDPGALGNGLKEKDLTLAIAKAAKKHLLDNYEGVVVKMTRESDATLSLLARTNKAISDQADSLVSIHINSAANAQAVGYEDFRHTSQSATSASGRLQSCIHDKVSPLFTKNRGKKQANYHMVREATVRPVGKKSTPSTLTECGFIVNEGDAELLKDARFLVRLGVAHAEGVALFHGLKRKVQVEKSQVIKPAAGSVKLGEVKMSQDVKAYAEPKFGTETGSVYKKGDVRHIYAIKNGWYQMFTGEWIPSNYGKNFEYEPVKKPEPPTMTPKPSEAKPVAEKARLRRVIVDGERIGSFGDYANLERNVLQALKKDFKKIEVEDV
ncbi:sporulation-specific N-acetylmuramoyl-L-alanine amidase [Exiguobacterium phage vB_EalM-137]|nr:sporulation-specific N-acetylmuramoyl-L-alanine amidase [Exiguobacterium phage vB_EalM-137]